MPATSEPPSGYADPAAHPLDVAALRADRLRRVRESLRVRELPAILLYDPINVRYATDAANMQVWALHNFCRYAFVAAEGPLVLFEFRGCEHLWRDLSAIDEVRPATSWYYWGSGARAEEHLAQWAAEIAELVRRAGGADRRLAVDRIEPLGVAALSDLGVRVVEGQQVMEHARARKSPAEIDAMRASLAVCESGLDAMRRALAPGIRENELWSHLHQTNIALGGEWIETRLLCSGPRTNPWFQECGPRRIEAGELVAFDTDLIGPYGYCADISRTWRCGDGRPSDAQRRLYATAYEQLQRNLSLLRPGLSFRELSEKGSELPAAYLDQRYADVVHGVGLADEYPNVVYRQDWARAGYDGRIEADMTLCVESYVGAVGGPEGVKLEEQVLVTETGAVPLSRYPFEPDFL